ncbi:MAG TPA: NAD(P)/FAD-dependent oxidoreductase [Longimicrobiales bacterium]|nr:NAD(P)/FAD-dependent oxidoreductase [Longimicrobiales bacterium]
MPRAPQRNRYDVVIAGARVAGAPTAMLLARRGLRVLVVDPARPGSDTLSTHALMRGAVLQLARWGLLDAVRAAGTPAITSTTFFYGGRSVRVDIKPKDGVNALYAPRRTVLDPILARAAMESGAEVVHGVSVVDVVRDRDGRVRGAVMVSKDGWFGTVGADVVIGADGLRSRVAGLLGAEIEYEAPNAAAAVYGYWKGLPADGYRWHYEPGLSVGTIPTNGDRACVFVSLSAERFRRERSHGLEELYYRVLAEVSPEVADVVASQDPVRIRGFVGRPGFLRRSYGPGWALVGDAGYFRDPITAHGITDALRDAELLAHAVVRGSGGALAEYQATRDRIARPLLDVTDRIASFDWTLEEAQALHLDFSRSMVAGVEAVLALDAGPRPGPDARPAGQSREAAIDARMASTV